MGEEAKEKRKHFIVCPIYKTQPTQLPVILLLRYVGRESVSQFILKSKAKMS